MSSSKRGEENHSLVQNDLDILKQKIFLGDIDAVKAYYLLEEKIPDQVDEKGYSLIHWIVYCDEEIIFTFVIDVKPTFLLQTTKDGNTILHIAAQQKSMRILRHIANIITENSSSSYLEHHRNCINLSIKQHIGNDLCNARNNWGECCLHHAAATGDIETIAILLRFGVNRRITDKWNRTPYVIAKQYGYSKQVLDMLYEDGMNSVDEMDRNIETSSEAAIIKNLQEKISIEFMQRLNNKNQPSDHNNTLVTVKGMYTEQSETLHGMSTTTPATTSTATSTTMTIASNSQTRQRMAISKKVEYPGDIESIQQMLHQSEIYDPAGKDIYGLAAIHKFASWNKSDLLDLLLPKLSKDEINSINKTNGYTALHYCVEERADRTLRRLLLEDCQIDRGIRDKKGRTAKDIAIEQNISEFINIL